MHDWNETVNCLRNALRMTKQINKNRSYIPQQTSTERKSIEQCHNVTLSVTWVIQMRYRSSPPPTCPLPLAVLAPLAAPLTLDTPLLFSSLAFSLALIPLVTELAFLSAGAAFAASRRSRSGVRLFTCLVSAASEDDGEPLPEDELCGGAIRYFSECYPLCSKS